MTKKIRKKLEIFKGCGNGQAALAFHEEGYTDVTGVDYSEAAIELSTKIAKQHNADAVAFKVSLKLMGFIVFGMSLLIFLAIVP